MTKESFTQEQVEAVVSALEIMGFQKHMPELLFNHEKKLGHALRKVSKDGTYEIEFDFFPLSGTDNFAGCVWTWTIDFQGRCNTDTVKPHKVKNGSIGNRYFDDYEGFMQFLVSVVKKYF